MADFGAQLRAAREQRGISLRQIAATTKISVVALEALERNAFSRLPGGIFSRAFVRAYALEVGLDPEKAVQDFLAEYEVYDASKAEAAPPEVTADDRAFLERQRRAGWWLRVGSIAVLLIAVAAVIWWQLARSKPATEQSPPPIVATGSAPVAPPPQATTPSPDPPRPETPPVDANQVALHFQATAECWLRVSVDGVVLVEQVLAPGDVRDIKPGYEVYVQVGNAGAMKWSINGQPAKDLGKLGQPATARVSRATLATYLQ
jgi:cytoskeleton protein RodZ